MEGIHGVALEARNLNRVVIEAMQDASTFAKHLNRAGTRTASAENIGVENAQRRTAQVAGGNALDEAGNIDVRRACSRAGCIEAVEAAIGFNRRGLGRKGRLDFPEAFAQLRIVG